MMKQLSGLVCAVGVLSLSLASAMEPQVNVPLITHTTPPATSKPRIISQPKGLNSKSARRVVAWQLTRIRADGEVDVTGNTRTGVGKETSYTGKPKDVNYNEVVFALTYYGLAHHDQASLTAADRVFAFSHPE